MEEMGRVSGSGAQLYTAVAVQLIPLEFHRLKCHFVRINIFQEQIRKREKGVRKKVKRC